MAIRRENIKRVALPREEIDAPELGGSVIVQGMDMAQVLRFSSARRRLCAPMGDESPEQAAERASGELLAMALADCVLADDGLPVYSAAEWAAFGAQHPERVAALWDVSKRLSGQDSDAEKKA